MLQAIIEAEHIVAMTGAGISAESGVPTFRDAQTGLWAKYDPTELATPEAFQQNPQLVWDWYQWRREKVLSVTPNPGHHALVAMANRKSRFTLITQNVDGLHQTAGSHDVIELHGNILRAKCFDNHHVAEPYPDSAPHPTCAICGCLMRPDVVWFHESLPPDAMARATEASTNCDVFLSIGTSSVVYPAAGLALEAMQSGATAIEINPAPTPLTPNVSYAIPGPSGAVLPALVAALTAR